MRSKHVLWIQQLVELLFAEQPVLEDEIIDAFPGLESLFGNLRRCFITDNGVEGRDDTDGVLHRLGIMLAVNRNAVDTFLA